MFLCKTLLIKLGPSMITIYSPKVLAKSQKARTHNVGQRSICKYGGFLFPIPVTGNFRWESMYSFSSKGRYL